MKPATLGKFLPCLLALSISSYLAAPASAADVELYGLIDEGLYYTHTETDGYRTSTTAHTSHKMQMASGIAGASRWGMKGSEDLARGYKISFVLEGKFNGDDGTMGNEGQLFDRDIYVELKTPAGKFMLGRAGLLMAGVGGGIFAGQTNPFGVVYKEAGANAVFQGAADRASNMIRYESPSFAGLTGYVQYSNATGLGDDEGVDAIPSSQRDRYGAIGATYRAGALRLALAGDYYWYNHATAESKLLDNPRNIGLSGSYDFGAAKVFGGYQYAKSMRKNLFGQNLQQGDANIVMAGLSWDMFGGTAMASAAYAKSDTLHTSTATYSYEKELSAWQLSAGYKYPLSKRTMIYSAAAYRYADFDTDRTSIKNKKVTNQDKEVTTISLMLGLQHKF